jgi:misacylated tRNA(Ala) deacylase
MSVALYLDDPYLAEAPARVVAHTQEGGVVLDRCLFYATGGGQPGDSGRLDWPGGKMVVATTLKAEAGIALVPGAPQPLPPVGAEVMQSLDWERRHRLDFDMPEAPEDRETLEAYLNLLVERDLRVSEDWITDAELDASPALVKTMSAAPPRGQGRVRLIRIGQGEGQVDLQPCGGTHVARTGEIGALRLGKVEKKGRQNRRVYLHLDD